MTSTVFIVHVRALFSALFSASVFLSVVLGQSMNYGKSLFGQLGVNEYMIAIIIIVVFLFINFVAVH